jgi:hypothetical protein
MIRITEKSTIEEVGAIVCSALGAEGIDSFLSGGAVVSIYTQNAYQSWDLDFVTYASGKKIEAVMLRLGFSREKGRHYVHPRSKFFVEFPGMSVKIGEHIVRNFAERKTKAGVLKLLPPTECVMDRLSAFYFWNDPQGLEQAVLVAKAHPVNLDTIRRWSRSEGHQKKYDRFIDELKRRHRSKATKSPG